MLYEWKKIGEIVKNEELIKNALFLVGEKRGTMLQRTFLRQLTTVKNWDDLKELVLLKKYKKGKSCSICGTSPARPISKYIFPFIIEAQKFPNLYPLASQKLGHYVCKNCTLALLSAYACIFWYVDRRNNRFMGILPYSQEKEILEIFINKIISSREIIQSGNNSNIAFYNKLKGIDILSFSFSYPYEFCFRTLYFLIKKIPWSYEEQELLKKCTLRIFIFRIDNAFKSKSIVSELNVLSLSNNLWELFKNMEILFLNRLYLYTRKYETLRKGKIKNQQNDLIFREEFFKDVMEQRRIRGELIEELLIYNLSKSEGKDKLKWYKPIFSDIIFKFLKIYYKSMKMEDEKLLLKITEEEGKKLGSSLLEKEGKFEKVKAYIYELRRCRSVADFMDMLNNLQLRADFKFSEEFIRITREKRKEFKEWKVYFLIGMANSILSESEVKK